MNEIGGKVDVPQEGFPFSYLGGLIGCAGQPEPGFECIKSIAECQVNNIKTLHNVNMGLQ